MALRSVTSSSTRVIEEERGHETFISNTFMGQHPTVGGDGGEKDFSGVAIDLTSNDNDITDVTIFSSAIGIVLGGEANIVTGFTDVDQVVIDQNYVNGMSLKSTAGNGTKGGEVVGFPAHAVTNVSSNVVVIESEKPVDRVVSVSVDQHNGVGEKNFLM
ncbi:hypothetical protein RND71_033865 [Anisodus tanguticus]|uniref:Uncharacterized protein n=1 Tax=Anisodus tanguticus TaxID=243964 RepID=A0AAE1RA53_9SOLA|nr:hypothetical protein RND71_033865 [Anisodus tanguticus]